MSNRLTRSCRLLVERCGPAMLVALVLLLTSGAAHAQAPQPLDVAQALEQAYIEAIGRAEASVVAIARVHKDAARTGRLTQSVTPTSPDFVPNDYGTGVIIDRRGLILTSYHVLGKPEENDYYVWINRRPFRAELAAGTPPARVSKVRAADPWMDLAVLQIDADDLTPITFGDAGELKKGQIVIALGNPFAIARDGQVSASRGIIANLQRAAPRIAESAPAQQGKETLHHYGTLIQTDAKLNSGMSGGALINLRGEMIGLITSLAATTGYEPAASYAVPTDQYFRQVVEALKAGREPEFGFLGVQPEHLSEAQRRQGYFGARVETLVPGTPAAQAGLRLDDIITHVDERPVHDANDLIRQLSSRFADETVQLTVVRGARAAGRSFNVPVTLSKKYVGSLRPVIAEIQRPEWRGMHVEYATALPRLFELSHQLDPRGCVGVLDVQPESAAWKLGMRPGDFISHVEGERVFNPEQFHRAVASRSGPVRLTITSGDGTQRVIPPQ